MLTLLEAVKTNNFLLYSQSLTLMAPLFFAFGGQNYARYLTYFSVFLANIESSHPRALYLIKKGAISVARSFVRGNRAAVDKTMEETFMRHAKSQRGPDTSAVGMSGILTNYQAYQRWVRTTNLRSQYLNSITSMADMTGDNISSSNKDVRPKEIKQVNTWYRR